MDSSASAADAPADGPAGARGKPVRTWRHSERLYVPWWGWPLPMIGAVLLAMEIDLGYPDVREWIPFLVVLPLAVALVLSLGRTRVRVSGGDDPELWVGDAHLPLRFAGQVDIVAGDAKRRALGPQGDPTAFVVHRGWVRSALRIRLTDPADPTPYWFVSTRHPEKLADLVRAASGPA